MSARRTAGKAWKFEEAMARVEDVIAELESGNLSLEDSLARFEEGIRLSRLCAKKLDEAEKRINVLLEEEGVRREAPFDPGARDSGAERKG